MKLNTFMLKPLAIAVSGLLMAQVSIAQADEHILAVDGAKVHTVTGENYTGYNEVVSLKNIRAGDNPRPIDTGIASIYDTSLARVAKDGEPLDTTSAIISAENLGGLDIINVTNVVQAHELGLSLKDVDVVNMEDFDLEATGTAIKVDNSDTYGETTKINMKNSNFSSEDTLLDIVNGDIEFQATDSALKGDIHNSEMGSADINLTNTELTGSINNDGMISLTTDSNITGDITTGDFGATEIDITDAELTGNVNNGEYGRTTIYLTDAGLVGNINNDPHGRVDVLLENSSFKGAIDNTGGSVAIISDESTAKDDGGVLEGINNEGVMGIGGTVQATFFNTGLKGDINNSNTGQVFLNINNAKVQESLLEGNINQDGYGLINVNLDNTSLAGNITNNDEGVININLDNIQASNLTDARLVGDITNNGDGSISTQLMDTRLEGSIANNGNGHVELNISNAGQVGNITNDGAGSINAEFNNSSLTGFIRQDVGTTGSINATFTGKHWEMTDSSSLNELSLDGTDVIFAATSPNSPFTGRTLTVKNLTSTGDSSITLYTVFGDDNSETDKVVIDGGIADGTTALNIQKAGGVGALTSTGIMIVDAVNGITAADSFTLDGRSAGYRNGADTLAHGLYDYSLVRGGNNGDEDSWYLTSERNNTPDPNVTEDGGYLTRPETAMYIENRRLAMTMNHHRWQDRQAEMPSDVDNPSWVRIEYDRTSYQLNGDSKRRSNTYKLHLGTDVYRHMYDNGSRLDLGVMALIGTADSKTTRRGITAKGDLESYNLGLYLTWQQNPEEKTGAYVDTWLMQGWNKSTVKGDGLANERIRPKTLTVSAEAGYSFLLSDEETSKIYLQPQAQLIWGNYRQGSHLENTGTWVSGLKDSAVTYRLGARLYADITTESGKQFQPFLDLNYWNSPSKASVYFDNELLRENAAGKGKSFEISLGSQMKLSDKTEGWLRLSTSFGSQKYRSTDIKIGLTHKF